MSTNGVSVPSSDVTVFPWVSGAERGAWVAERVQPQQYGEPESADADRPEALAWLVPTGFETLVRVLHPFTRDRPRGVSWAEFEAAQGEMARTGEWGELPPIDDEPVSWGETSRALEGEPVTGDALSYRIVGLQRHGGQLERLDAEGYRYGLPQEGRVDPLLLARIATVLARHTETLDRGTVGVWEGWGGLTSANGVGFFFGFSELKKLPWPLDRLRNWWLRRTVGFRTHRENFGTATALRTLLAPWARHPQGSGALSKEAATGPKLELPDRTYICFEAGIDAFAREPDEKGIAAWAERAPWVRPETKRWAESPSLIWPADREWFMVTEIDFDSTLIACSRACADELLNTPGVEAFEIDRDTRLWG